MKKIKCRKAENCFANAESYIYTLPADIDDAFLEKLKTLGKLEVKRNFRRPFFYDGDGERRKAERNFK